jgi:hypothetical protein
MGLKRESRLISEEEKRGNLTTAMANDLRVQLRKSENCSPSSIGQQARIANLPSRKGPCEVCKRRGEVRYFVAAKLPRPVHLCDEHYLEIRGKLENALVKIMREEHLF